MLQSTLLAALPTIRHAFFTRDGGVSSGLYATLNGGIGSRDNRAHVAENRARMARALRVSPDRLLTAFQVHSADVVVVEGPWRPDERPRADAMVTAVPGLALGVSTADCAPVLFADTKAGVIGAAHAGWRGAFAGVLEATLAAMEALGAARGDVVAAVGPLIRQPSYEVGEEFKSSFLRADAGNERFFAPAARAGHALFDLGGYVGHRLRRAGVERIEDLQVCTYADPERFYSFRRSCHREEPDYGRHVSAIVLAG